VLALGCSEAAFAVLPHQDLYSAVQWHWLHGSISNPHSSPMTERGERMVLDKRKGSLRIGIGCMLFSLLVHCKE